MLAQNETSVPIARQWRSNTNVISFEYSLIADINRISDILTGTEWMTFGSRWESTSSIRKTPMRRGIGNATLTKLFAGEMKSTREISIESALITGGHCIE